MSELNKMLKYYLLQKSCNDPHFRSLKVLLSGSDQPGEGEHKILQYIRCLKKSENFDANWTHCIYSPDADMIVLGLLSRLENVVVMRQEMVVNRVS